MILIDVTALKFISDVGVLDEEGFLSLKGRAKELIKKGGEQVSPFEVEEPLLGHPVSEINICFCIIQTLC